MSRMIVSALLPFFALSIGCGRQPDLRESEKSQVCVYTFNQNNIVNISTLATEGGQSCFVEGVDYRVFLPSSDGVCPDRSGVVASALIDRVTASEMLQLCSPVNAIGELESPETVIVWESSFSPSKKIMQIFLDAQKSSSEEAWGLDSINFANDVVCMEMKNSTPAKKFIEKSNLNGLSIWVGQGGCEKNVSKITGMPWAGHILQREKVDPLSMKR